MFSIVYTVIIFYVMAVPVSMALWQYYLNNKIRCYEILSRNEKGQNAKCNANEFTVSLNEFISGVEY